MAATTIHFTCSTIFKYLSSGENPVEWFIGKSIVNGSKSNPCPKPEKAAQVEELQRFRATLEGGDLIMSTKKLTAYGLVLTIALLSGCSSISKGITQAYLEHET